MKLTKEGDNRYRGQDGLLYNREGEVIDASQNTPETSNEACGSQAQSDQAGEQTPG
jgi:hypothetical protein